MIFGLRIFSQKGSIPVVRNILQSEFHLVPARDPNKCINEEVLVWEDTSGVGRYRVHFYNDSERAPEAIQFSYWMSKARAKREILIADPMKVAVDRVLATLDAKVIETEMMGDDCSVDEALHIVFREY